MSHQIRKLTMMEFKVKIVVPVSKPRSKWLNDILRTKRSEAHASMKNPTRSKAKAIARREISEAMI